GALAVDADQRSAIQSSPSILRGRSLDLKIAGTHALHVRRFGRINFAGAGPLSGLHGFGMRTRLIARDRKLETEVLGKLGVVDREQNDSTPTNPVAERRRVSSGCGTGKKQPAHVATH